MIELYELRILEKYANLIFRADEGNLLSSGITRKVLIAPNDPRIPKIAELSRSFRCFLGATRVVRKYTKAELNDAEVLTFFPSFPIEPPGEAYGTVYDESSACPVCGADARQVSDLYLKDNTIPRSRDISGTINYNEVVVSRRFLDWSMRSNFTGVIFRKILKPIQLKLRKTDTEEIDDAFQLIATSSRVNLVPPTRIGRVPFGEMEPECRLGHFTGLWPFTELSVSRADWDGSEIFQTKQVFGNRAGMVRPFPMWLVTQRFYRGFKQEHLRSGRFEVAHFV